MKIKSRKAEGRRDRGGKQEGREAAARRSAAGYWLDYLGEKKAAVLLYCATVFLFVVTCCLYQLKNADRLFYAALLTLALWTGAGLVCGGKYVEKRRMLETVEREFGQAKELRLQEICGLADAWESGREPRTAEQQLLRLLTAVDEERAGERGRREEQEADRRDYFLAWTHQIKTPIAAMRLLLEEAGDREDNFRMREELFKIEQYAEMVLTIQRLESMGADLVLEEYELVPLLRQAVRKYSVLFINRGLQVEVPEWDGRILTDEKWFSFCLEQILSNAIKYTAKGKITLSGRQQERDTVLVVEDTGMGIRAEDLPRIFERGFTGYNGRTDKRATGIGLYLCQKVCRQLGITITVESSVGKGTRVELVIPRTRGTDLPGQVISGSRPVFSSGDPGSSCGSADGRE